MDSQPEVIHQTAEMYFNWVDWRKFLYFYLSDTVMVTIENHWYSAET